MQHKLIDQLLSSTLAIGEAAKTDSWMEVGNLVESRQAIVDKILSRQLSQPERERLSEVIALQERVISQLTGELTMQRKGEAGRQAALRSRNVFLKPPQRDSMEITG